MAANPILPEIFGELEILPELFGETPPPQPTAPADASGLISSVGVDNLPPDGPDTPESSGIPVLSASLEDGVPIVVAEWETAPVSSISIVFHVPAWAAITLPDVEPAHQKPSGTPGGNKKGDTSTDTPVLAATYTSGQVDGSDGQGTDFFNLEIQFYGEWSYDLMQAFATAADFLSEVVTGGLRDDASAWNTFSSSSNTFTVDDVLIEAYLPPIDGEGQILGRAGPYSVRDPGSVDQYTTVVGLMEFDSADAASLQTDGNWDATVLHEMIHTLGLGSLWDYWGVTERTQISGQNTKKPTDDVYTEVYTGAAGTAVYAQDKDASDPDQLMVETDGGSGTAGAHWDDATYGTELMTGYLYPGAPYLEDWTIASLADIGYSTADYSYPGTATNRLNSGINLEDYSAVNSYDIVDVTLISDYPMV